MLHDFSFNLSQRRAYLRPGELGPEIKKPEFTKEKLGTNKEHFSSRRSYLEEPSKCCSFMRYLVSLQRLPGQESTMLPDAGDAQALGRTAGQRYRSHGPQHPEPRSSVPELMPRHVSALVKNAERRDSQRQPSAGIGCSVGWISLSTGHGFWGVKKIKPGTPAARSEMLAGDVLHTIDGQLVSYCTPLQIKELMLGPVNSKIELDMKRMGQGTIELVYHLVLERTVQKEKPSAVPAGTASALQLETPDAASASLACDVLSNDHPKQQKMDSKLGHVSAEPSKADTLHRLPQSELADESQTKVSGKVHDLSRDQDDAWDFKKELESDDNVWQKDFPSATESMYVEEIKDLKQQLALLKETCRNKDQEIQELMAKSKVERNCGDSELVSKKLEELQRVHIADKELLQQQNCELAAARAELVSTRNASRLLSESLAISKNEHHVLQLGLSRAGKIISSLTAELSQASSDLDLSVKGVQDIRVQFVK